MKKSDLDPKFEALFNKIREEAELTNEKEINDYGAETSDILMPDGRCYEVYTYLDQKHSLWEAGGQNPTRRAFGQKQDPA